MPEDRVERRLAAILAADVAGYSRLMGEGKEGTLAALKAHRRAVLDPKIIEHRGRIVKNGRWQSCRRSGLHCRSELRAPLFGKAKNAAQP